MAIDPHSLLGRHVHLMRDVIYTTVEDHGSFTHLECQQYPDAWYNFIVPTVGADSFPFDEAEEIIAAQKEKGITVSYYLHAPLRDEFIAPLDELGYKHMANDEFLLINLQESHETSNRTIEPLTDEYLDQYLEAARVCFPDWENNPHGSNCFYRLMKDNPYEDKIFQTFIILVDDTLVSFGSVILDHAVDLGYLHNDGTLEEYRRQGFHADLTRARCDYTLKHGINDLVTITEKDSGSYKSFDKLGFNPAVSYGIYVKDE